MFSRTTDASLPSGSNSSSVDWECDGESRSWSSSASWSDDVEGEATGRLWQQLQDIDSVLYGEASPRILPLALQQEVAQWRATFPHLRISGTKPPMGPRPAEEEEGEEEVYASHGEALSLQESDPKLYLEQKELQDELKSEVMQKLFDKVRPEIVSSLESKSIKDLNVSAVSVGHQREPLLAHRQSARKDNNIRKQPVAQEPGLGSILRVSPLPRRMINSRTNLHSSRSSVVLPPIDPVRASVSAIPLGVFGKQSRLVQQKPRVNR